VGRQIRFFLCDSMRAAIEGEAARRGVKLVSSHPPAVGSVEFSHREREVVAHLDVRQNIRVRS
jgi:hypothetical protein